MKERQVSHEDVHVLAKKFLLDDDEDADEDDEKEEMGQMPGNLETKLL